MGVGVVRGQTGLVLFGLLLFAGAWLVLSPPQRQRRVQPPPAEPPEEAAAPKASSVPVFRATRCTQTGRIVRDPRKDGDGCPEHTELRANGGSYTPEELRESGARSREDYPHGRYCCDDCKWVRDPVAEA